MILAPCPRCHGTKLQPQLGLSRMLKLREPCSRCLGAGTIPDELLSEHFHMSELTRSADAARAGLPNDPGADAVVLLRHLCLGVLEPIRHQFGVVAVDSGYRSDEVNKLVGGSLNSAHREGAAADIKLDASFTAVVEWLMKSGLAFDQVIVEYLRWIHIGIVGPRGVRRREALMIFERGKYLPFDAHDERMQLRMKP